MAVGPDPSSSLRITPLNALHRKLGARMVAFAGYDMPVQYEPGILKEHLHTRSACGLFDVSHMGQIMLRAHSGDAGDAARALETLVPGDILDLAQGRQRYTLFTNGDGGIRDDLMVSKRPGGLLLVVNAACKTADEVHLRAHLAETCEVVVLDRALIALQGPKAEDVLARFAPDCRTMRFMDVRDLEISGAACIVARSGYTGEDGFEISLAADGAAAIAEAFLADERVQPAGLGARDSLRLEAGLPLYGADLTASTTPVDADLSWAIPKPRRTGGARQGNFPGAGIILDQLARAADRVRVGLRPQGRQPVREGAALFAREDDSVPIGSVTSGGFGPSIAAPIAMGYVAARCNEPGRTLYAQVRSNRVPLDVSPLPFVPHTYKR